MARLYPGGFSVDSQAVGSHYVPPAPGTPLVAKRLGEMNGQLTLGDGDLDPEVVQPLTIESSNRVDLKTRALPGLQVVINPVNGRFNGSFVHPATGTLSVLRGVIFQKRNAGFGFFLGQDESGYAKLTALP